MEQQEAKQKAEEQRQEQGKLNLADLMPFVNSQITAAGNEQLLAAGDGPTNKPADLPSNRPADQPASPATDVPAAKPAESVAPKSADATPKKELQLKYGDPKFDEQLAAGNIEHLKLEGLPKGVSVSPWLDNKGFFIWFKNGNDNRAHHYIPATLKTIEVDGVTKSADELRIEAAQAYALKHDDTKNVLRAIDGTETVFQYGKRMSALSDQNLQTEVARLAEAAKDSKNPHTHFMYANFLTAQVIRPILNNFNVQNNNFKIDKATEDAIDAAAKQAAKSADLARDQRNFYIQLQAERLAYVLDAAKDLLKLFPKEGIEVLPPLGK